MSVTVIDVKRRMSTIGVVLFKSSYVLLGLLSENFDAVRAEGSFLVFEDLVLVEMGTDVQRRREHQIFWL
jgi:hypothetical protein